MFKLLYFGFSYASSMIKRHHNTPSNFGSRQTYRQTHRQLIAFRIWEGGGNRLIDRYVLHLMPSNVRLHFIDLQNKYIVTIRMSQTVVYRIVIDLFEYFHK